MARYFDRVRALFEQYRDISGGKLQLSILDPEPFSDAEDKAVAAGLKGLRLNAEGEVGYFGLVASNATDNQQTIPFFSPDRELFLEYDVTKLIYALANPKKRTIGLMTSLPLDGGKSPMRDQATQPWLIMGQIREFFDVRTVDQDVKEIPSDIDVLMVAQPTQAQAGGGLRHRSVRPEGRQGAGVRRSGVGKRPDAIAAEARRRPQGIRKGS